MSEKQAFPSDAADKVLVRMPDGMRGRLKDAAKSNNRTMNAEIVARLDESFQASARTDEQAFQEGVDSASLRIEVQRLREQLHAERMQKFEDRASADATGRLLETLPMELVTQYGLHLYREQLDRIRRDADSARRQFQPLYEELQSLLSVDGPPGPRLRAKEAVSALQKRIHELEEQAHVIEETITGIHTYRKVYDLPELRSVKPVHVSIRGGAPVDTGLVVHAPPTSTKPGN